METPREPYTIGLSPQEREWLDVAAQLAYGKPPTELSLPEAAQLAASHFCSDFGVNGVVETGDGITVSRADDGEVAFDGIVRMVGRDIAQQIIDSGRLEILIVRKADQPWPEGQPGVLPGFSIP